MGVIRDLIKGFDDSDKIQREQKAHLDTLSEFALAKAELFKQTIELQLLNAGVGTDKTIPINQIEDFVTETHAYISSNADKITDGVMNAIKGFVAGGEENTVSAVGSLISTAVTALFGNSEARDDFFEKHYVILEGVSLVRLDLMGWKRSLEATSLTTKVEQVSAFVMYKSSVSLKGVEFDTFLDYYQLVAKASSPNATPEEIIDKSAEIYKKFKAIEG